MRTKEILSSIVLAVGIWFAFASPTQAQQTKTSFVYLGSGVPGLLYEPAKPGSKVAIGVFLMHAEVDYLQFSACAELSKRGYRVLCANNSASKSGLNNDQSIDKALLDAKLGVAFLRNYPGIRKVVLLGHSGGAALMSAYQSIAENGLKACQGPEKLLKCPDSLADLPPADGLILLDANYGMSGMTLLSLDPAVADETTGKAIDAKLDLFNPHNGFDPNGSIYSDDFIHRFQAEVGHRETRLIATALDRLAIINAGNGRFSDDEPFVVPGASYPGFNNKLFAQDTRLLSHTRKAWPVLHKDGTMTTQIVHTVRVPDNATSDTSSLQRGALKTTVRNFLSTYALRVTDDFGYDEDSVRGVDWLSSYTVPPGNVQSVTAPLLTMGMTGHWEYLTAELIFEHAKSADKTIVFVEGANHSLTTCTRCEKTAGEFGDTLKTTFDYVDSWLSKPGRF
jgi:hypothetical protein